jgi:hypothetical protein
MKSPTAALRPGQSLISARVARLVLALASNLLPMADGCGGIFTLSATAMGDDQEEESSLACRAEALWPLQHL